MVNGSRNLDLMLKGQRSYFAKTGLGFEKEDNKKSPKNSQRKIPTRIYCFKKGHPSEECFCRRNVKRQKVKKSHKITNQKDPKRYRYLL